MAAFAWRSGEDSPKSTFPSMQCLSSPAAEKGSADDLGLSRQVPGASRWRLSTWELPEDDKHGALGSKQTPRTGLGVQENSGVSGHIEKQLQNKEKDVPRNSTLAGQALAPGHRSGMASSLQTVHGGE